MKSALSDFVYQKKGIYGVLHIIILLLCLFLIISISIDTFHNITFLTQKRYLKIQWYICLFFLFDFVLEFILSKQKLHYLKTHFVFLLVSIPYVNIIDYYQFAFSPEVSYFLRFIPLVRGGYALAIVVGWLTNNRASGLFVSYLTMLIATVYFSSLIFFVLEQKVNPMVHQYTDALWWAFMDVTTVGSNIYAMTPTGKTLSVILAALGMMMFPIFTVYVTSIVQRANERKQKFYEASLQKEAQEAAKNATEGSATNGTATNGTATNGTATNENTINRTSTEASSDKTMPDTASGKDRHPAS